MMDWTKGMNMPVKKDRYINFASISAINDSDIYRRTVFCDYQRVVLSCLVGTLWNKLFKSHLHTIRIRLYFNDTNDYGREYGK